MERSVILDLQHQGMYPLLVVRGVTFMRSVGCAARYPVENRLYSESMGGATTKSNPAANKLDNKELVRLRRQDHWIQVTRMKLLMDLIFVCKFALPLTESARRSSPWPRPSVRRVPPQARQRSGTNYGGPRLCSAQVSGVSARALSFEALTGDVRCSSAKLYDKHKTMLSKSHTH